MNCDKNKTQERTEAAVMAYSEASGWVSTLK